MHCHILVYVGGIIESSFKFVKSWSLEENFLLPLSKTSITRPITF